MKTFKNNPRVKVISGPLDGKTGTVVRRRLGDNGAWVDMDEDIPEDLASFSRDDHRRNNVLLYPEDCLKFKSDNRTL